MSFIRRLLAVFKNMHPFFSVSFLTIVFMQLVLGARNWYTTGDNGIFLFSSCGNIILILTLVFIHYVLDKENQ